MRFLAPKNKKKTKFGRPLLRWEQPVQSMVRVIQGTAEKAFICLFHQLDNVWHIRWTVVTALASPYERIDSLKIGACLLYTSPSPRDRQKSRMPSSA